MYNKILIPLDGSKLGEAALPFVDEIILGARADRKIEVTLLQVVSGKQEVVTVEGVAVRVPNTAAELEQIKKSALTYLDKAAAMLQAHPMATIKTMVRVGEDPADQILRASDEMGIDLIAISTHGRSGISRWALGSVADRILRNGNTPVFMVRAKKAS